MQINDIRVFIPSTNYEESQDFYRALGFDMNYVSEDLSIFESGDCTFFLQNYFNEELAKNFMFQLVVSNIDEALEKISSIKISGVRYEPIKNERWGKVIYLWGPSGELLHVTQLTS